ncbi:MAG: hypothetical protein PHV87_02350, partial [Bacilli bacterium]|nr:hypothetical protein [Bacilli bacterium]
GIGPGSYTGLRVSVTIAKILGWALSIPVYTISSLNLLASDYLHKDGIYAITLIANKNYVYGKLVRVINGVIIPIFDDMYIDAESFFKLIEDYNYVLINEDNYRVNPTAIKFTLVSNIHDLSPNYLRRGV